MKELYKKKIIFDNTSIWAEGINDWNHLSSVSQFRWTVVCKNLSNNNAALQIVSDTNSTNTTSLYNFSELCCLILDIFIQMCEFFPSR